MKIDNRKVGIIKQFDPTKRYGFIKTLKPGEPDIFVHAKELAKAGLSNLPRNEIEKLTVKYDIKIDSQSSIYAANIEVIKPEK